MDHFTGSRQIFLGMGHLLLDSNRNGVQPKAPYIALMCTRQVIPSMRPLKYAYDGDECGASSVVVRSV